MVSCTIMYHQEGKKSLSVNWKLKDQSGYARLCCQKTEPQSSMTEEERFTSVSPYVPIGYSSAPRHLHCEI